jgi:hypothetical protein
MRGDSALIAVWLLLGALAAPCAAQGTITLTYVGSQSVPTGTVVGGVEFGGISGIFYNPYTDRFVAVTDDSRNAGASRWWTLSLAYTGTSFTSVAVESQTQLRTAGGDPLPLADTEGIAGNLDGSFFVSHEGLAAGTDAVSSIPPWIWRFDGATGRRVAQAPLPVKFLPGDASGNPVAPGASNQSRGVVSNLSLECLGITPSRRFLFTANEAALKQDYNGTYNSDFNQAQNSETRIVRFTNVPGAPVASEEKVYRAELGTSFFGVRLLNTVPEILPVDDTGRMLVLERGLTQNNTNLGSYRIRIYLVDFNEANATNVAGINALVGASYTRLSKTLLWESSANMDNVEAMCWGRDIDGFRTLVLASDNNFSAGQVSQFHVLRTNIPAVARHNLALAASGSGSVTASPAVPWYPDGSEVTLTATTGAFTTFTGWSGSVSGTTNPAVVVMDANKSVQASFLTEEFGFAENFDSYAIGDYPVPANPLPGWNAMTSNEGLVCGIADAGGGNKVLRMDSSGGGAAGWSLVSSPVLGGSIPTWTVSATAKWLASNHPASTAVDVSTLLVNLPQGGLATHADVAAAWGGNPILPGNLARNATITQLNGGNPYGGGVANLKDGLMISSVAAPYSIENTPNSADFSSSGSPTQVKLALDGTYDLARIDVFTSYQWSRVGQKWSVFTSTDGGTTWSPTPLASVNITDSVDTATWDSRRVTVQDSTPGAAIATGVNALRFDIYDTEGDANGVSIFSEIAVYAVPAMRSGGLLLSSVGNGMTGDYIQFGYTRLGDDTWARPYLTWRLAGISGGGIIYPWSTWDNGVTTTLNDGGAMRDNNGQPFGLTLSRPAGGGALGFVIGSPQDGARFGTVTFTGAMAAALDTLEHAGFSNYLSEWEYDNLELFDEPRISAEGAPAALATTYGTPSAATSFTVSGLNMGAGILVTPPAGFEVSTDNTNFSPTVAVGAGGMIPPATIHVRLAAATPVGTWSGDIVLSGGGASAVALPMAASTVSPTFQTWQAAYFQPGEFVTIGAPGYDAEGDGIPNLLEYALNLHPREPSVTGLPALGADAGSISLTYRKDPTKPDVGWQVEVSTDLVGWDPVGDTLVGTEGAIEIRRATVSTSDRPKKFLRLKVIKLF